MILFLRHLIFHDFWLKLFSLVLAILIWLTVSVAIKKEVSPVSSLVFTPGERMFYNLPITIISSAADVRDFKVSPHEVELAVRGDAKTLQSLQGRDIRVFVDLTTYDPKTDKTRRIEVATPAGVSHWRVNPDEVQIIVPAKTQTP
jgi:YbbR domain-containing protein